MQTTSPRRARSRLSSAVAAMLIAGTSLAAAAQPTLDEMHKRCHDYAATFPSSDELENRGFGSCDAYMFLAEQEASPAHLVLAGIHMQSINSVLSRMDVDASPKLPPGTPVKLVHGRRKPYLWDAGVPATKLRAADAWIVPELVTALGKANGFDFNDSAQVLDGAYTSMTADGLKGGPEWAALTTEVASFSGGRAARTFNRDAVMADFPNATAQLVALPAGEYRTNRLYRAYLGSAELQRSSNPVGAFDALMKAHAAAVSDVRNEVDYVQLLIANLLRDHTDVLAAQRHGEIMRIIETSPEPKFKDRLLDSLAETTSDCAQVLQLFDLGQQFKGKDAATPAAQLMLAGLYGMKDKADALVVRLSCLDASRLKIADSDGQLVRMLGDAYPRRSRDDSAISKAVAEIERNLR